MESAQAIFFPPELPTILLRLFLAFLAGAIMGWERERFIKDVNRRRGAGFRTYSLVCFGSCLFGLASIYGFPTSGANDDPGRVAAQVVTGMWVASAIGLMFSAWMYITAIVAAFFAYLTLDFHRLFPKLFHATKTSHFSDEYLEEEEQPKGRVKPDFYDGDHD